MGAGFGSNKVDSVDYQAERENKWYEHDFGLAGGKHIGFLGLGNLGLEAASALIKQNFTVSGFGVFAICNTTDSEFILSLFILKWSSRREVPPFSVPGVMRVRFG